MKTKLTLLLVIVCQAAFPQSGADAFDFSSGGESKTVGKDVSSVFMNRGKVQEKDVSKKNNSTVRGENLSGLFGGNNASKAGGSVSDVMQSGASLEGIERGKDVTDVFITGNSERVTARGLAAKNATPASQGKNISEIFASRGKAQSGRVGNVDDKANFQSGKDISSEFGLNRGSGGDSRRGR